VADRKIDSFHFDLCFRKYIAKPWHPFFFLSAELDTNAFVREWLIAFKVGT